MSIPFVREFDYEYGRCDQLSPLIRRVIAPNPGPFTYTGTGTYIIGSKESGGNVAVIDPGPLLDEHLDAILDALDEGERVTHILITHTHADHSPLARPLAEKTGATIYGYGPHGSGKADDDVKIEEGGDMGFTPDVTLRDSDLVEGDGWTVEAIWTPGHTSNHLCFALREEKILFPGDHVMGWSTSVISPPDGDMDQYMQSLEKLLKRDDVRYWPTHGPHIDNPQSFVQSFIDHRLARDAQIIACLKDGADTIGTMVPIMYKDVDARLHPAAARSVLAHIERLVKRGAITTEDEVGIGATYSLS